MILNRPASGKPVGRELGTVATFGRFPPHAVQHHSVLTQGRAGRQKPTRFSRWTLRGERLLCEQMRSFSFSHLTGTSTIDFPSSDCRDNFGQIDRSVDAIRNGQ
jgi:hypothetical protein